VFAGILESFLSSNSESEMTVIFLLLVLPSSFGFSLPSAHRSLAFSSLTFSKFDHALAVENVTKDIPTQAGNFVRKRRSELTHLNHFHRCSTPLPHLEQIFAAQRASSKQTFT
jgi:predicted glycoside hydrolase/deacetylase ChbG (UPF0249 family)